MHEEGKPNCDPVHRGMESNDISVKSSYYPREHISPSRFFPQATLGSGLWIPYLESLDFSGSDDSATKSDKYGGLPM